MKILIGSSSAFDKGSGIAAAARALSEGLLKLGDEVVLASPAFSDESWLSRHQVAHVLTDPGESPSEAASRALSSIRDMRIDAVINNDNSVIQCLAPLCRVPFISVMHMQECTISALAAYNSGYLDYVVSISSDMQRIAVERYGLPVHKVPIIYNGVPDLVLPYVDRTREGPLRVIFAGGGNRGKGADLMIKLVRSARFSERNIVVHWFDVMPQSMRRMLEGIPFVKVHGRVPAAEFLEHMAKAHVLLMPSRMEGCPMVLLEAMCRGVVPIVGDGVGAMRWIVQGGRNGFVCSLSRWAEEACDCLDYLVRNESVYERFARESRRTYVEAFTDLHMASAIRDLLQRPTVQRVATPAQARLLKWTRPVARPGVRVGLWERWCFRTGLLREDGSMVTVDGDGA